jgi:iron complex transport system permease protein
MQRVPGRQLARGIAVLLLVLIAVSALALSLGSTAVDLRRVFSGDALARTIVFQIRLPRLLAAAVVGAILGAAGSTFQALLRNPLADPFILGVSGGAACAAAVASAVGVAGVIALPLVAFGGAAVAVTAVYAISLREGRIDTARVLLGGLVLNALFSAVILIALSSIRGSDLNAALRWMMGSFGNPGFDTVGVLAVAAAICLTTLVAISPDIRLLAFGEDDATARGVAVDRVKRIAFVAASLATGAAVAAAGIIGFVGLLVPHLVRRVWTSDFRVVLPLSAIAGAVLLVAADLVARIAIAPAELPVGAITALLGVPFFLSILRRAW